MYSLEYGRTATHYYCSGAGMPEEVWIRTREAGIPGEGAKYSTYSTYALVPTLLFVTCLVPTLLFVTCMFRGELSYKLKRGRSEF
jgi:hypothetical protein